MDYKSIGVESFLQAQPEAMSEMINLDRFIIAQDRPGDTINKGTTCLLQRNLEAKEVLLQSKQATREKTLETIKGKDVYEVDSQDLDPVLEPPTIKIQDSQDKQTQPNTVEERYNQQSKNGDTQVNVNTTH